MWGGTCLVSLCPLPCSYTWLPTAFSQYKFGLHKYVGQRVRVWLAELGEWREGEIASFGQK